ncbi:hypothetical protein ACTQ49_04810 [Luteococcus sp. Sow4_B9]|uniref:hypothetical protein n=1 Tax=Luteococcus sp. Sow4_B9 TaxID=3438792 RepID=UPI003F9B3077
MKLTRVAVPMAALALFAGCSTPSAGVAFQVADNTVTMDQVNTSSAGCERLVQQQEGSLTGEIARMLLTGEVAQAVAEKTGTQITPAMRSKALTALQGESLTADADCATAVNGFADFAAINEAVGQEKVQSIIRGLDVKVNPRFGNWDSSTGTFSGTSGSLSMEDVSFGEILGG